MATRIELLNGLEADLAIGGGFWVPSPVQAGREVMPDQKSRIEQVATSIDGQDVLEWHICYYWDGPATNMRNAHFWVRNRGQAGEDARWHQNRDPMPDALSPTFQADMLAWLHSQIDNVFGVAVLRHVERITADEAIERGTADVIMETGAGDFVRQSVAIWKNLSEEWQFEPIAP